MKERARSEGGETKREKEQMREGGGRQRRRERRRERRRGRRRGREEKNLT